MEDGDGNRVAKTVNGVTTRYLVDDLNPTDYPQVVDELTGSTVSRTYTYGLQRISQYQVVSNAWTPSFYMYDGLGNVRELTNASGTVTDQYEYDAFGNEFTVTGGSNTPNEMMYRGEQYDSDLGLYYLRARYYNPLTGRFMSRDPDDHSPYDPTSLHKYLYAKGDPIDGVDPGGRGLLDGVYIEVETDIPWISTAAKVSLTIGAVLCKAADWLSWISTHLAGGPPIEVPEPWPLFCLTR